MSTQRTITVFSTKGKRKATINTDVSTWGELKPMISDEGYDLSKLLATENIKRNDLANEGAVLPEGDFTIFLRPTKTKSGTDFESMSTKEVRAYIKDAKVKYGQHFIDHINSDGNWTRTKSDRLKELLASYTPLEDDKPGFGRKTEKVEVEESNVADVVDAVKEHKKEDCDETLSVEDVKGLLTEVIEKAEAALNWLHTLTVVGSEEADLKAQEEAEEAKRKEEEEARLKAEEEARLKEEEEKRRAEEEQRRLDEEAADMMAGF